MPDKSWLDAMKEVDEMIDSGESPSDLVMSIQSYETYGGCVNLNAVQPISDSSFLNGVPFPASPSTGWDKIDDNVDSPNTSNFVTYTMGYPGPDTTSTVSDVFNAGGIPAWPVYAKIRICCNDTAGGGASGQWHQCVWKSADNKTIGTTAYDDLPSIENDTIRVSELDFVLATYDPTADLSSTKIQLRLINGNVCEVNVYAVEVIYGIDCGACDTTLTARPVGLEFQGWNGDVVSSSPPLDRWEILATNNFTDSSYDRYVKIAESVGSEPYETADIYSIGPQLSNWPSTCKVRIRCSQNAFPTTIAVTDVWVYDETFGDMVASWEGGFTVLAYSTSPYTAEFTLAVEDYNEAVDLTKLVLSVRYSMSSGITNTTDFRLYAYDVHFDQSCPDLEVGGGTILAGGSHAKSTTFGLSGSGGVLVGGESIVLAGLIGSGGMRAGGSAETYGLTNETGTGGMKLSGKQYQYRRTITVPAGKVSQDFESFYLGVVAQINPAHVGTGFFVTSAAGPAVPYEVRSFVDGKLSLWVRTPLKAASDTVLYLYYGAT